LKHAGQRVIYPIIIPEELLTSGEVRERIKETVSKTYERQEQTKTKTKKKEEWCY
jgi:DNA-binding cell septation regulator SpoVG